MKNSTYEVLENSNKFFEKIENFKIELSVDEQIKMIENSVSYNLINNNDNIYQILKLK